MRYIQIKGGLQYTGVHDQIEDWVSKYPGVDLDSRGGRSTINGRVFLHGITFKNSADFVAFKLVFDRYIYEVESVNTPN